MYNAQITKDRIMNLCRGNSEQMLKDLSLGVNAIRQITDTKGISSFSLAKIADYLSCSVDYLLGRVDETTEIFKRTPDNAVKCLDKIAAKLANLNDDAGKDVLKYIDLMAASGLYNKTSAEDEKKKA